MQKQTILIWNTARCVWEIPNTENLLCGHSEGFWATWLTSGTMRNGRVYERQMPEHPTTEIEYSLLPTTRASEPGSTSVGYGDSLNDFASRVTTGYAPKDLAKLEQDSLFRSPKASEGSGGALGEQEALKRGNTVGVRDQVLDLVAGQGLAVSRAERNHNLLGTPRTSSANSPSSKEMNNGAAKSRLEDQAVGSVKGNISWGRFEPAVRRWEEITGMPAPEPTKPDGKDGAHRLSSEFTEWMMGLPSGWVTGVGLSRRDELTACGNGVVPQQAYVALEMILGKKVNEKGERIPMLPTPTPSDSYIGNLKSEQTKEGSMHSVNLPKAINLIREEKL